MPNEKKQPTRKRILPTKAAEFGRLAVFASHPNTWPQTPVLSDDYAQAFVAALTEVIALPNVQIGVDPYGTIDLIYAVPGLVDELDTNIRSRLTRFGLRENASTTASDPTILALHRPFLRSLAQQMANLNPDQLLWLSPADAGSWLRMTSHCVAEYARVFTDRTADEDVSTLFGRHRSCICGQWVTPSVVATLERRLGDRPELRGDIAAQMKDLDIDLATLKMPVRPYWAWRPFEFRQEVDELTHLPVMRLANYPATAADWGPPVASRSEPSNTSADASAELLNDSLWATAEFLMWSLFRACGLSEFEPMVGPISCLAPLFYVATPVDPPHEAEAYAAERGRMLISIAAACLQSPDPMSHGIGWGLLQGSVLALRREDVDDHYRPRYVLLPAGASDSLGTFENEVGDLVSYLTSLEFSICQRCDSISAALARMTSQWTRWQRALESLSELVTEGARLFSPAVSSPADIRLMMRTFRLLNTPILRLQAALKTVHDEAETLSAHLANEVDNVQDSWRSAITYAPLSVTAATEPLYPAVEDAYPLSYLKQPIEGLPAYEHRTVEGVVAAFRSVLDDADRSARGRVDRITQNVGLLIGLAAAAIALPTIMPDIAIKMSDYKVVPGWLSVAVPAGRFAAIVLVATIASIVIFQILQWVRGWFVRRLAVVRVLDRLRRILYEESAAPPSAVLSKQTTPLGPLWAWIAIYSRWLPRLAANWILSAVSWLVGARLWGVGRAQRARATNRISQKIATNEKYQTSLVSPGSQDDLDSSACDLLARLADELVKLSLARLPRVGFWSLARERVRHGFHSLTALTWVRHAQFVAGLALLVDLHPENVSLPRALSVMYWKASSSFFGCTFIAHHDYEEALMRRARFTSHETSRLVDWIEEPENYRWVRGTTINSFATRLRSATVVADPPFRDLSKWTGSLASASLQQPVAETSR